MRACLADLLATVERAPRLGSDVAKWLCHAAAHGDLPDRHFGWEALALDDAFALASRGIYGSVEDALARLLAFLRKHAAREA